MLNNAGTKPRYIHRRTEERKMEKLNVVPLPNSVTYLGGCTKKQTAETEIINDEKLGNEGYRLKINENGIVIEANTPQGIFYGKKTLQQLGFQGELPCAVIEDKPCFPYRGFMVDSARHMQSIDELKRLIDAAALLKFNVMHWHLSDDQGYRIESEKFPLLNEKGSWRTGDDFGARHTDERYGGYYTKAEIKAIVSYCAERFIEVIPEIDIPGHTTAIIHSYPYLSCKKLQIPVKTKQGIFDDILCVGDSRTLEFLYGLFEEVIELFPGERFHIGGDEAPKKRWDACPKCRAKMRELGLENGEQLQGWLTAQIVDFMAKHGKKVTVWNESLAGGKLPEGVLVQRWMDAKNLSSVWANRAEYIINSDFYHYYCDYPYHMTPLRKTYNYSPIPKGVAPVMEKYVLGIECPMWTEYIYSFSWFCYMAFPRFAAVAERAWTNGQLCECESFENRFSTIVPQLNSMGIFPAPSSDWNPTTAQRLAGTLGFFKDKIDLKSLSNSVNTQKN